MSSILPHNLANIPHVQALVDAYERLLEDYTAEGTLIYLIDTVSPLALPYLADQFDVLGYRGYKLATTDEERRNVIKTAVLLKKYNGTIWAIKQAMLAVGYGNATIAEHVANGDTATDWANFTINADLGNGKGLDAETPIELTKLINEYKNVRSKLLSISFTAGMRERMPELTETLDVSFAASLTETLDFPENKRDGTHLRNGTVRHRPGFEDLQIHIVT